MKNRYEGLILLISRKEARLNELLTKQSQCEYCEHEHAEVKKSVKATISRATKSFT